MQEAILDSLKLKVTALQQLQSGDSLPIGFTTKAERAIGDRLGLLSRDDLHSSLPNRLSALYSLKSALPLNVAEPVSFSLHSLQAEARYGNDFTSSDPSQSGPDPLYRSSAAGSARVGGVPFAGGVNWGFPTFFDQAFHTTYKVSFNREEYLNGLRKKLNESFNVKKILLNDFDFQSLFKSYAQTQLTAYKAKLQQEYSFLGGIVTNADGLSADELLLLPSEQVQEKLFPKAWLDSLYTEQGLLQTQLNTPGGKDSLLWLEKSRAIDKKLVSINQLKGSLLAIKKAFETEGLNYNQLVRYQQGVNKGVNEITGSEQFVKEASKNLLPLKGLSRLFLHVQELNIGQFATNWSKGALGDPFLSGVGGSFFNKGKYLGLNLAQVQTLGWLKDGPFTNALFEPATSLQALRLGSGKPEQTHAHFSMVNATTRPENKFRNPYNFLPRNTFVGSYSQHLSLGDLGALEAEVSKSASQYRNTLSADKGLESGIALKELGADFWQTLSVGLRYEGDFEEIDFRPKVFASYAGLGYTNPVSTLQSRGSLSFGSQLQKRFFQNRLSLQSRFSKRVNRTAVEEDRKLTQLQNTLGANYRITKKLKLGMSWNYSDLSRTAKDSTHRLYYSNRLSTDFSLNTRLGGNPLYQYANVGFQKLSVPDLSVPGLGNMLWLNSSTTLGLAKGTLSANLQVFSNLDATARAGALLTSDIGWTYTLVKRVAVTTALNYLDQKVAARQLGLRHTISAAIGRGLGLQVFADFRKDLVENQNELLFPSIRGEATITYNLK